MQTMTKRAGDVAKKAGRPKKAGGEGKSVRIGEEVVNKARIVALRRGVPFGDYLTNILGPVVDRDYQKTLRELASEQEGGGK